MERPMIGSRRRLISYWTPIRMSHGLTYRSHDFSGGGDSSFGLCPGVRFVITRVASIGKSFEIDDQPLGVSIINTVLHC